MSWETVERGIRRYKRRDGGYTYWVDATYKKKRLGPIRAGSSLESARTCRRQLLHKAEQEDMFPELKERTERIKLDEFIPRYVDDYLRVRASRSYDSEKGRVRRIQEHFGNAYIDEISVAQIERFLNGLLAGGILPYTVNSLNSSISSMLK